MRALLAAISLLTRLPVRVDGWSTALLARGVLWFPVVGGAVGAAIAGLDLGLSTALPAQVAALLAVAAGLLLTGALHEDGLADTADGLGGGRTAEDALRIFRDSRVGTYGALAVCLGVLLRVAFLASMEGEAELWRFVVASATARAALLVPLALVPPARPDGLAAELGGALSRGRVGLAVLGTAAGAAAILGIRGALAVAGGVVVAALLGWYFGRRVGGMTGDGLGAAAMLGELAALVVLVAG